MDFGISLDPLAVPQRHALYDSESEEEGEQETQSESEVFRVDKIGEDGEFLAGKALLLALGNTASVFAKSFIRIREEPFLSLRTDVSRVKSNSPRGKGAEDVTHFYYSQEESSKWAVCLHAAELQAEHCNHWADKVFDCGQPNKVVVFVCRSQHEHFSVIGSCGDTAHLMRSLQSSSWPHPPPLGMQLEPPNTLQGEAAAILTLCELRGIPCVVNILYAGTSLTETEKVMAFLPTVNLMLTTGSALTELPIRGEKEGEVLVKKWQPRQRTELANLYT